MPSCDNVKATKMAKILPQSQDKDTLRQELDKQSRQLFDGMRPKLERKQKHHKSRATLLPAKSDSEVMFCSQSYQGLKIDRSLVY